MKPYTCKIEFPEGLLVPYHNYILRKLSSLKGQFLDETAYRHALACDDILIYEVYESDTSNAVGDLHFGLSIVHPGKIGDEYFMTKGHFHQALETAEVYYCLRGRGVMVMEDPDGNWAVEELRPDRALYIPPFWGHRSVNTGGQEDLVTFFVYPGYAGHDYGTIEVKGFRKAVVEKNGEPQVIDNPKWIGK